MVYIVQNPGRVRPYRIFGCKRVLLRFALTCGTTHTDRTVLLRQVLQQRFEYFDQGIQVRLVVSPGIDGA